MIKYFKKSRWLNVITKSMRLNPLEKWQKRAIFKDNPEDAFLYIKSHEYQRGVGKTTTVFIKALIDGLCTGSFDNVQKYFYLDPDFDCSKRMTNDYCNMFRDFVLRFVDKYCEYNYLHKIKPICDFLNKFGLEKFACKYKENSNNAVKAIVGQNLFDNVYIKKDAESLKLDVENGWRNLIEGRLCLN